MAGSGGLGGYLDRTATAFAPEAAVAVKNMPLLTAKRNVELDQLNAFNGILAQLTAPPGPSSASGAPTPSPTSDGMAAGQVGALPAPPVSASPIPSIPGLAGMDAKSAATFLRAQGPSGLVSLLTPKMVPIVDASGNPAGQFPEAQLSRLPPGYSQAAPQRTMDSRELASKTVVVPDKDGINRTMAYNPMTRQYDIPVSAGGTPAVPLGDVGTLEYLRNHPAITGAAMPAPPQQTAQAPPTVPGASPAMPVPPASVGGPATAGAPRGGNPFAAAIDKATLTPGQAKLQEGGAADVIGYAKDINDQAKEADATLPDLQQLKAARRIFNNTGTLGEYQNYIIGAAQNLGLGNLAKDITGNDPLKAKAAAGQIIEKMTVAGGFANKPESIQRLTQQEVQNLSKIFPGAINQSDDAANVMMGLKEVQLLEKQKMRDALTGMIDPRTGAPPTDLRAKMLPYTIAGNKTQKETIDRLMGNTFGPKSLGDSPNKPLPKGSPPGSQWAPDGHLYAPTGDAKRPWGIVRGY